VKSEPRAGLLLVSGLDLYRDRIRSWRADVETTSGHTTPKRGLYPDGARALSAAIFTHLTWQTGRLGLEGGTRFSRYPVSADDPLFGRLEIAPGAWVSSVAASYAVGPGVRLVGSASQAFRAPNVDDVSTLGAFDYGIEVPSTELDPERSVGFDAGLHLRLDRFSGSLTLFRSELGDLIDRTRSTFLGSATFEGQQVYRRQNVGEAYVQGAEVQGEWNAGGGVVVFGHATYTYGQQTTANQPMRRIPPLNGLVGARWETAHGAWLEATVRLAAAQRRLSSGDRDDYRIPAGGTPGWMVVSVNAAYPLSARAELTGSLHNLFDEAYRVHGSGIDGYGRSAWVGTRIRF
jgi:hemoglobin/transferrin/lactoferrin receptor protein